MRSAILDRAIDSQALLAEVSNPSVGAVVLFIGAVRANNAGRAVTGIEYSAYVPMAERELNTIIEETAAQFGTTDIVAEHRTGTLAVGEASVCIVVAHAHRNAAYHASQHVIEELKRRLPVWKREHYTDGTRTWVHAGHTAALLTQPAAAAQR